MLLVLNSFTKNQSMTKSNDLMSQIFRGQASRPHKSTGTRRLLYNSCRVTSSEAILSIFPKIATTGWQLCSGV